MSYRCSFRDIQGSKRPNTIHFLFLILLFYFEELKKINSNITGRTVSALFTEELLEKIMLAKTKHKKVWKFYWNPFCCLGRVMDIATVSSLYCIVLYDNYIALNDKVQKWRNFSKNCWNGKTKIEGAQCHLVLKNSW
jgi:hypothetical protein